MPGKTECPFLPRLRPYSDADAYETTWLQLCEGGFHRWYQRQQCVQLIRVREQNHPIGKSARFC